MPVATVDQGHEDLTPFNVIRAIGWVRVVRIVIAFDFNERYASEARASKRLDGNTATHDSGIVAQFSALPCS